MKLISFILTVFLLKSCGSTANTAMEEQNNTELNGSYTINMLADQSNLPTNIILNFDKETKRVSGSAGCNNLFGNYSVEGNTISFKNIGSTRKLCDDDTNKIEVAFLNNLSKVKTFSIKNNTLSLSNDEKTLMEAKSAKSAKMGDSKMAMETSETIFQYTAYSRGSQFEIKVTPKTISYKNGHSQKPTTKPCDEKTWDKLTSLLFTINLKDIPELEPPSKAHQYDGAAIANLTIIKNNETYRTKSFDAGKPNKTIEALVNELIALASK